MIVTYDRQNSFIIQAATDCGATAKWWLVTQLLNQVGHSNEEPMNSIMSIAQTHPVKLVVNRMIFS
jgi:hypothetical protein